MISISIAISFLTTRCYSISHSGPFNVSGIEHEDAWFPLQTSLGHNGHRPVPTADDCVVVFLSVWVHIVLLRTVVIVAVQLSVPPVGLTCSQLDCPDGLSQEAELRSVQVQPLRRSTVAPEGGETVKQVPVSVLKKHREHTLAAFTCAKRLSIRLKSTRL